jgi:serine/threonine protein kinase
MSEPKQIGKYTIDRRLGGGGMAEVYLGHLVGAEGFSRPVAIKRVLPGYSDDPRFAEMFVKEANLSARLVHQNLVSVLDFDRDPEHGLYLVMELVRGCDLSRLMAKGALPVPVAIYLVSEILAGLGYAHHLPMNDLGLCGLVHRDVSPQNVLLSWDGAVKVSDFGIAKAHAALNASASVVVKGKLAYMSPEQANGQPLDGRSDLFAVGVMLWEMLTGQALFHGSTQQEALSALFVQPIPSPREVRPEIPADVAAVAMRLLQRNVAARIANADRAIEELRACRANPVDGRSRLIDLLQERVEDAPRRPTARTRAVGLSSDAPSASGAPALPASPSSRRSVTLAVGIAATLGALGATGGWLWSRRDCGPAAIPAAAEKPAAPTAGQPMVGGRLVSSQATPPPMAAIPNEKAASATATAANGAAGTAVTAPSEKTAGAPTAKAPGRKVYREAPAKSGILKVQVDGERQPPQPQP